MRIKRLVKSVILAIAMAAFCAPASFASQKGEKVFGVRTGYISRNRSADLGLFFQYTFSEHFRLQPSADLVFRHHNREAFTVDLNAHVPIAVTGDDFSLYPLAGINFSSWNHHFDSLEDGELITPEWSSRTNRFGANFGAGFDLKVTSTLKISIEACYTFIKSNSGVRVLAGIGYVF